MRFAKCLDSFDAFDDKKRPWHRLNSAFVDLTLAIEFSGNRLK
jgi:hypothetical protein